MSIYTSQQCLASQRHQHGNFARFPRVRRPLIVMMVHDPSAETPRCRLQEEDSEEYGPPIVPETAVAAAIKVMTEKHLAQTGGQRTWHEPSQSTHSPLTLIPDRRTHNMSEACTPQTHFSIAPEYILRRSKLSLTIFGSLARVLVDAAERDG